MNEDYRKWRQSKKPASIGVSPEEAWIASIEACAAKLDELAASAVKPAHRLAFEVGAKKLREEMTK